jgi:glycosyltransferase involved in cell wall biosynthesis
MRILLINGSDLKGGAAQVAWNLANGLRQRGHDVEFRVDNKSSDAEFVVEMPGRAASGMDILDKVIYRLGIDLLGLRSPLPHAAFKDDLKKFDLIHLHDLGAFNWRQFEWLSKQAPVVWTIHCMGHFTGGCIYSYECDRYMRSCGACPQVGKWPMHCLHRDGTAQVLALKRWFLHRVPLRIIGVSDWIGKCCSESRLFQGREVTTIHNAVDPKRFYPSDREAARARLGVPQDARAVMFSVAGDPQDTRKGLDLAIEAFHELLDLRLFLLPLGIAGESSGLHDLLAGCDGLQPRHVHDDATLRDYYAAADLVWHPSRADTSSMVSLEAFACGTPVIAADVGGVPEVVPSTYGMLIPANDSAALAEETRHYFMEPGVAQQYRTALTHYPTSAAYEQFISEHERVYQSMAGAIRHRIL